MAFPLTSNFGGKKKAFHMVYYIRNYFINKYYTNELMLSVNEMKQTMICKKQSQHLNSNIISTKTLNVIKPQ
jgi:hypothetical protein